MSASHVNQLRLRKNPQCIQYGYGGEIRRVQCGQNYTIGDVAVTAAWLNERAAGYPPRDLPWPEHLNGTIPYSDEDGATWLMRTPWALLSDRP